MVNICSYFFRVVRDFSGSTVWGCCCCCCGSIFLGHSRSALRKGQRPCDCSCVDRVSQQSASMFKGNSPVVLRHWRPQVAITTWQLLDFLNMIWKSLKILQHLHWSDLFRFQATYLAVLSGCSGSRRAFDGPLSTNAVSPDLWPEERATCCDRKSVDWFCGLIPIS